MRGDLGVGQALQLRELRRQLGEREHRDEDDGEGRRDEEATVDRGHAAAVTGTRRDREDADHGSKDADRGDDEREDETEVAERSLAEDQRRNQRDGVALEQVGGHAGAVAHVVAHVVGDRGRVARVIFGDALLDLADEVGSDIGGLSKDAATNTHEHRQQGGAESETFEHLGCVCTEEQHDQAGAEQAQAHGEHAGDTAGTERDTHRAARFAAPRSSGDSHVGAYREPHAGVASHARKDRTNQEEDRAADALAARVGGQREEKEEDDDREDAEGSELPLEVGAGALLHGRGDALHVLGALVGRQHLAHQGEGHSEREQRHDRDNPHPCVVATGDAGRRPARRVHQV